MKSIQEKADRASKIILAITIVASLLLGTILL